MEALSETHFGDFVSPFSKERSVKYVESTCDEYDCFYSAHRARILATLASMRVKALPENSERPSHEMLILYSCFDAAPSLTLNGLVKA